ncbi:MAG: hypothetical protein KTV77_00935 [Wolbachia endosymbiont of Fragariocoptes setiger]|nr:hypothetical protein [Wolbachia endosymbiont of Fragariocoptes setiger]
MIVRKEINEYRKIFDNLSKEVKNLQKDSSSYILELEKLCSTKKEKEESFSNLLKNYIDESDQDFILQHGKKNPLYLIN